ncbi:MAG: hypothetical protein ACE5IK_03000 [Acidobacteriota bacterium]
MRAVSNRLPDNVRLALRRYFPSEVSARSAAYYALPEHLALLRLRSEAENRMLRWTDVADDLRKSLKDLAVRVTETTAFSNSYAVDILLHEDVEFPETDEGLFEHLKAPVRTAHISASFLTSYWTIGFRRWRKNNRGDIVVRSVPQQGRHSTRVANLAKKVLTKHGWKKIPSNLAQTKIPGIDLRSVSRGEVRVADIVFGENQSI